MKVYYKLFFFSFLFQIYGTAFCQPDSLVPGAYHNITELKKKDPFVSCTIEFKKSGKYPRQETNETFFFQPEPVKKVISRRTLRRKTGFIFNGEQLYINCFIYGMGDGFSKIEIYGKYSYFTAKPMVDRKQEKIMNDAAFYGGITGAVTASVVVHTLNKDKIHYVVNLESGVVHHLDKRFMEWILQNDPDLLIKFKNTEGNDLIEIQKEFLEQYNQRYK